jgi:two-component system, OmpR family, sensor kinase
MTTTMTTAATMTMATTTRGTTMGMIERSARARRPTGLRTRVLAWLVGLLAVATVASVVVTREVLLVRLDQRIDRDLVQESEELRRLARGVDPATGRRFGPNVRRIFEVYLQRNVPAPNEALITFLGGEAFLRSRPVLPYRLDRDPELAARWGRLAQSERGQVSTPAGRVEYLAVPLRADRRARGVFVAAVFRDREKAEVDAAVRATGGVGLVVLLLGSLLAWRFAGTVVRPVTALTRTAREISETDLSRRIPVRGRDEVAELATTFNEMLGRLEHAFATQRQFIDDAGHELKTPLTIVRGHLELVEEDPEERRKTLALVLDELDRMGRIVDDLLLLAKREQPDFLNLSTVEVGALTDELHAKVSAIAAREWVLEGRGRGVVVADRQRLTQAVVQLAQNAVRYSPDGEPVALGSALADGEARFWVRDGGPGIPAEERERIFERFRRGSRSGRSDGAGLGLPIVKAIAEAHHGRVEIESGRGGGTTVSIVVPVDQPEQEEVRA